MHSKKHKKKGGSMESNTYINFPFTLNHFSRQEVLRLIRKIEARFDTYHRQLGGYGVRLAEFEKGDVVGISIVRGDTETEHAVTLCFFPRSGTDDPVLLELVNSFIDTPEFAEWIDSVK